MKEYRHLSESVKQKILDRDILCVYCGATAEEVDHVVPWSWSHCDDEDNLVAACSICNHIASNFMFPDFDMKRNYIRARRAGSKKIMRKIIINLSFCVHCGVLYKPGLAGSTRFYCKDCYDIPSGN
jgi:5-methylcytosine-specific restriction endonuclease McrA